ncbi:MAG: hypothetical protein EAZ36_01290 [Verrucomicrobia bacterium]|nr:MAG: hypothetical protein EAZ36_01290 [Verrucomicrobiota bacterium]
MLVNVTSRVCLFCLFLFFACDALGSLPARAEPVWPISGKVSGSAQVTLPDLDLGLSWRVESNSQGLSLHATRPGIALTIELRPDTVSPPRWSWRITQGEFDLGEIWPSVRAKLGAAANAWSASGRLELSGVGRFDAAKGLAGLSGQLTWRVTEGWARSDALELSGIELTGAATGDLATETFEGNLAARLATASMPQAGVAIAQIALDLAATTNLASEAFHLTSTLGFTTATAAEAGIEARDATFRAEMNDRRSLTVNGGQLSVLGGLVTLRPFTLPLESPALLASVDVKDLLLGEVARLVPWIMQSAQGKLRGRVEIAWDAAKGLRLRDGGLDIVKTDDASFRLTPSPGLLTGTMQPVFGLAPPNWKWGRWMGLKNPAYLPLKAIEEGKVGLKIESFQVSFWPDGVGVGRPMAVHILGRPTNEKLVDEVRIDINFHGPLAEAIAFGLNQDFTGFNFAIQ